jgi:hypothetical protein
LSVEAEVAIAVLDNLVKDVAVLCHRGVLFAQDNLDAGVDVAILVDELRGSV